MTSAADALAVVLDAGYLALVWYVVRDFSIELATR